MGGTLKLGRRPALNGLRGVAVLLVLAGHTHLLPTGFVGVDIFFILSGFLITCLLCEEAERSGGLSFAEFWERRSVRLLPALLVAVAAYVVGQALLHAFPGTWTVQKSAVTSLTFTANWSLAQGAVGSVGPLGITWTLAQEAQFYLAWPLILAVLLVRRTSPARLALVLAVIICGLLLLGQIVTFDPYYNPLNRAAELSGGCLVAILWRHRLLPPLRWGAGLGTGWLALVVGEGLLSPPSWAGQTWLYMGTAFFTVPLLIGVVTREHSPMARLLATKPLAYIGVISYGIYLYHRMVLALVEDYLPGVSQAVVVPLEIGLAIAVAAVSWEIVESRLLHGAARGRLNGDLELSEHRQRVSIRPSERASRV